MKAATGELNMTLVTVSIIGAFFAGLTLVLPSVINSINNGWSNNVENTGVNFGIASE